MQPAGSSSTVFVVNFFIIKKGSPFSILFLVSGGGSRPSDKGGGGGGRSQKTLFSALRAPVWSENKVGGPPGPFPWIRHSGSGFENLRDNELNCPLNWSTCPSPHLQPYVSQGGGITCESRMRSERLLPWDLHC